MTRNYVQSVRAVHLTAEKPGEDRLVISARIEMKGYQFASQITKEKEKLSARLHAFAVDNGYNPLHIKFHSSRK